MDAELIKQEYRIRPLQELDGSISMYSSLNGLRQRWPKTKSVYGDKRFDEYSRVYERQDYELKLISRTLMEFTAERQGED